MMNQYGCDSKLHSVKNNELSNVTPESAFAIELLIPNDQFIILEDIGWSDEKLARAFGVTEREIELRKRLNEELKKGE